MGYSSVKEFSLSKIYEPASICLTLIFFQPLAGSIKVESAYTRVPHSHTFLPQAQCLGSKGRPQGFRGCHHAPGAQFHLRFDSLPCRLLPPTCPTGASSALETPPWSHTKTILWLFRIDGADGLGTSVRGNRYLNRPWSLTIKCPGAMSPLQKAISVPRNKEK